MRLAGHHALVTGGGSGIGAAVAKVLAKEGARLTLVGRRREPLEEVANYLRSLRAKTRSAGDGVSTSLDTNGVCVARADITDRTQVDAAFDVARAANGPITILVANAGAAAAKPFAKVTAEEWRAAMDVNLDGVFHCCQAALPDLLEVPSGRIVTIASVAGLKGGAYIAPYVAAKHGAVGLTRALAAEFARTRLTVNAVCPGFTDTAIVSDAIANIRAKTGRSEEEALASLTATNAHGRLVSVEEVAAAVLWLCLPESGSVNGQAIAIAGGEI